jgi:hypothetical protein
MAAVPDSETTRHARREIEMPTDAVVVTNSTVVDIGFGMTPIVQLAPMQSGRSYLVWASGDIYVQNASVTIELEAFDAKDTIPLFGLGIGPNYSFSLAVGTTLPADEDLFMVAKLSAAISEESRVGPSTSRHSRHVSSCSQLTASRF